MKFTAKKTLSIILATLMLFSVISVPAYAADETVNCTHSYSESDWVVVKEPNCHSSGLKRRWCKYCVSSVEETIPNDLNKHVTGLWEEIIPHTCTQEGLEVIYCYYGCMETLEDGTRQKIVLDSRTVPAHDFAEVYRVAATCQSKGHVFSMCMTCEEMNTVELDIDKDAHNFSNWEITKEATCVDKSGERTRECRNEGCKHSETEQYTDPDNHKTVTWFEDQKVLPTCDRDGYTPGTCEDCKAELRDVLPRHSASDFEILSTVPSTCHTNGVEHRKCKGYTDENGNFVVCGLEYDYELPLDPDNHVYGEWEITKEPGCQAGERSRYCIYEHSVVDSEKIPATGKHMFGAWTVLEEGTCSLTGLREKVCIICNGAVEGGKVTEETPVKHDLATWKTIAEMSCNETYLQQGEKIAYCNNCNYSKTFITPISHNFGAWVTTINPDCRNEKDGAKKRTCVDCGKTETGVVPYEHNFTEWTIITKPVCGQSSGLASRVCYNCDKTEKKVIPADHEYGEWVVVKQAVCVQPGQDLIKGYEVRTCKFCTATEDNEITADHVFGEIKVEVAPVCSKEGNGKKGTNGSGKRTCYTCGYVETVTIPFEHDFGNWYCENPSESVCGTSGATTLTHTCADCGYTETIQRDDIANKEHPNLKVVEYEATCVSTGYTMEVCPECGYTEVISALTPAKGHNLDEHWTTRLKATCNTPGSRYKACSECDYLEFEYISTTSHILIEVEPGVEPTCTEAGKTAKSYCGVCLKEFASEEILPLGHKYDAGSETCSRCYVYAGSPDESCVCACHSSAGMETIIFRIMCKIYSFFGINQYCKCGDMHYEEIGLFGKLFGSTTTEPTV